MEIHFIDVGCGNMTLVLLPNGSAYCVDCNITDDNESRVLSYLRKVLGSNTGIGVFVNSHRDADHMRGIKTLHAQHHIDKIWDTGVSGTTTDSAEYRSYMDFMRSVRSHTIKPRTKWEIGEVTIRCMNAAYEDYSDPNEQSAVLKFEFGNTAVLLAGDTNYRPWREKIIPAYPDSSLKSTILLAAHHGSITFFDDPGDTKNYYISHMQKINPAMTLISVGPNVHDLPDKKALELYDKYSTGSNKGNKVFTTNDKGTMKITLKNDGSWSLLVNQ